MPRLRMTAQGARMLASVEYSSILRQDCKRPRPDGTANAAWIVPSGAINTVRCKELVLISCDQD